MSVYIDTYKIKLFDHDWNEKKKKSFLVQCGEVNSSNSIHWKKLESIIEGLEEGHHLHNVKVTVELSEHEH